VTARDPTPIESQMTENLIVLMLILPIIRKLSTEKLSFIDVKRMIFISSHNHLYFSCNSDLCYVDMERSPQANHVEGGFALFPGDVEEGTHCHGFIWSDDQDDASNVYKANNLFYVSMEDHLRTRGYVRNVPGAPMCGCLEQMPTVSRADCTQTSVKYLYDFKYTGESPDFLIATVIGRKVSFNACDGETNNDLESKYDQMVENGEITRSDYFADIIVGEDNCADGIDKFLQDKGFTKVN